MLSTVEMYYRAAGLTAAINMACCLDKNEMSRTPSIVLQFFFSLQEGLDKFAIVFYVGVAASRDNPILKLHIAQIPDGL